MGERKKASTKKLRRPWRAGQKRVVEFGEWLCEEVLRAVPHRHFVFSIPKILRRYFLYDRKLLSELSRCAWETLKEFFQQAVPEKDAVPGAIIAIHSFGDFLGWHPHLHILCTDGCFSGSGMFCVAPMFALKHLEEIFRHKVFKMLLSKGKIIQDSVDPPALRFKVQKLTCRHGSML